MSFIKWQSLITFLFWKSSYRLQKSKNYVGRCKSFEKAKNKKNSGYCTCSFKNTNAKKYSIFIIILSYNVIFLAVSFEQFIVSHGFFFFSALQTAGHIVLNFKVKLRNGSK